MTMIQTHQQGALSTFTKLQYGAAERSVKTANSHVRVLYYHGQTLFAIFLCILFFLVQLLYFAPALTTWCRCDIHSHLSQLWTIYICISNMISRPIRFNVYWHSSISRVSNFQLKLKLQSLYIYSKQRRLIISERRRSELRSFSKPVNITFFKHNSPNVLLLSSYKRNVRSLLGN